MCGLNLFLTQIIWSGQQKLKQYGTSSIMCNICLKKILITYKWNLLLILNSDQFISLDRLNVSNLIVQLRKSFFKINNILPPVKIIRDFSPIEDGKEYKNFYKFHNVNWTFSIITDLSVNLFHSHYLFPILISYICFLLFLIVLMLVLSGYCFCYK